MLGWCRRPETVSVAKVGEAFLYKNDLVYVVMCCDNYDNRDFNPCVLEHNKALGMDFEFDGRSIIARAIFERFIRSESNLNEEWLCDALTINARDPSINLDDLVQIRIGGTFRDSGVTYRITYVMDGGVVISIVVFPRLHDGDTMQKVRHHGPLLLRIMPHC
jgi:hypothetical protein